MKVRPCLLHVDQCIQRGTANPAELQRIRDDMNILVCAVLRALEYPNKPLPKGLQEDMFNAINK